MNRTVEFSLPDITQSEIDEVAAALASGWITTGVRTKEFEKKIAEFSGTEKAACLNSCTAALELTLKYLGIGAGDEVITTAYTYTATASVICHVGAVPVLVDTAKDSFEMDYDRLSEAFTAKTKAVIAVDIGGKMCNYEKIFDVVEMKKELFVPQNDIQKNFGRAIVITDAAHAFGASRHGMRCGQASDFTCFSFHAVKNLTTGEGGAVTWRNADFIDNKAVYNFMMLYSLHGQTKDAYQKNRKGAWEYDIVFPAYKCNMTDTLAAVGLSQFKRYESMLERRRTIIERYDNTFIPVGAMPLVHYGDDFTSSGHLYLMRVPGIGECDRNKIIAELAERGVSANVHYKPLPMLTAYKNMGFDINDYPNAYNQYINEISLPLHTKLSDEDVGYVCDQTVTVLKGANSL